VPSSTPAVVGHENVQRTGLWCVVSADKHGFGFGLHESNPESQVLTHKVNRTWFATVFGEETSYMRVSKKDGKRKQCKNNHPFGVSYLLKKTAMGGIMVSIIHAVQKKRNDKRAYIHAYICIYIYHI